MIVERNVGRKKKIDQVLNALKNYGNEKSHGNSKKRIMSKEPKIMKMDWRSLGYWPVWKDGKIVWEKDPYDK